MTGVQTCALPICLEDLRLAEVALERLAEQVVDQEQLVLAEVHVGGLAHGELRRLVWVLGRELDCEQHAEHHALARDVVVAVALHDDLELEGVLGEQVELLVEDRLQRLDLVLLVLVVLAFHCLNV